VSEEQKQFAVGLLQRCLPHLDLAMSDHNDGHRLCRDICAFLAGLGYTGEYHIRYHREAQPSQAPDPPDKFEVVNYNGAYHWKVRQG
jgi:hypothetical protein